MDASDEKSDRKVESHWLDDLHLAHQLLFLSELLTQLSLVLQLVLQPVLQLVFQPVLQISSQPVLGTYFQLAPQLVFQVQVQKLIQPAQLEKVVELVQFLTNR